MEELLDNFTYKWPYQMPCGLEEPTIIAIWTRELCIRNKKHGCFDISLSEGAHILICYSTEKVGPMLITLSWIVVVGEPAFPNRSW